MTRILCRFSALLAILTATAAFGCSNGPKYTPVSGIVTHQGKPLAGATVVFTQDPNESGTRPATAVTEVDGTFHLQSNLPNGATKSGALPGNYKVTVSKFVPPQGMSEEEFAKKVEAAGAGVYSPTGAPSKVELLPPSYSAVAGTKVAATVTAAGPNEITITIP